VKCDETKPNCHRCLRFNGECDGYELDVARSMIKNILPTPLAPIAPKIALVSAAGQGLLAEVDQLQLSSPIEDPESLYLLYFQARSLSHLTDDLDERLWSRVVLQACESEPGLRHAFIAIGALEWTLELAKDEHTAKGVEAYRTGEKARNTHYEFAIQQYNEAVNRIQETLADPQQDTRIVLMAYVLFLRFETLHGNNFLALDKRQSGMNLVNSWLQQYMGSVVVPADGSTSPGLTASHDIEGGMIHAFPSVDNVKMLLMNGKKTESNPRLNPDILEVCRLMPQTFFSVEEAKMY
jgi:hypothetical protein